jgi:CRISP-associated protein Cas1
MTAVKSDNQSLVYDLQEPFRWIADVTVLNAFESGVLDLRDFYFTADDYRYRFEAPARRRFIDLLRERFNGGVRYDGRVLKWDTVIERKAMELGRYLVGRTSKLNLSEPSPTLQRHDSGDLRKRILGLSESEARRHGLPRSTYYHLKRSVKSERSFTMHARTRMKLQKSEQVRWF